MSSGDVMLSWHTGHAQQMSRELEDQQESPVIEEKRLLLLFLFSVLPPTHSIYQQHVLRDSSMSNSVQDAKDAMMSTRNKTQPLRTRGLCGRRGDGLCGPREGGWGSLARAPS